MNFSDRMSFLDDHEPPRNDASKAMVLVLISWWGISEAMLNLQDFQTLTTKLNIENIERMSHAFFFKKCLHHCACRVPSGKHTRNYVKSPLNLEVLIWCRAHHPMKSWSTCQLGAIPRERLSFENGYAGYLRWRKIEIPVALCHCAQAHWGAPEYDWKDLGKTFWHILLYSIQIY